MDNSTVFNIDILPLIWKWLDLVDARAPSAVCHVFLHAFTRVHDVWIREGDLMDKFESPEEDGHGGKRLQLHHVFNYVSSRFLHIHTLRISFTDVTPSYFHGDFHRQDPDCLSRLLLSCAPELEELDIFFPSVTGNAVARALLGPPKECAFCQKKDFHYSKMSACGACGCVYYCFKSCQRKHWRANHRRECASKRDAEYQEALHKQQVRDRQLHDPVYTIARHPLRRLGLSNFFIPNPVLKRLLGKLVTLQGAYGYG